MPSSHSEDNENGPPSGSLAMGEGGGRGRQGVVDNKSSLRSFKGQTSAQEIAGGVSEKLGRTASDLRGALASQAANASSSWKRFRSSGDERGRDFSDGDGDGRYSRHERKAAYTGEADVYEGEPLLREEVAEYIGVDFRDGTGPAALLPNDVARAFRNAEDFAQHGCGINIWSALTNNVGGGGSGGGASGSGAIRGRRGRDDGGGVGGISGGGVHGQSKRVVHVESATTGTFFKVYERVTGKGGGTGGWVLPGSGSGSTGGRGGGEEADGGGRVGGVGGEGGGDFAEDRVRAAERLKITVREVSLMSLNKGVEAAVLLVQGVLAGLTLASVYTLSMATDLENFVASYESQASEFRRAMFLLCTLALMGTEDQLFQTKGKRDTWAMLSWSRRFELRAGLLLYGGCMVSTLVCGMADTAIANANGSTSDAWYVTALEEGRFRRKVALWYGFNLARFVLSWAGWFLVCRQGWRASLRSDQSQMDLKGQRMKLSAAEEQISRLNGRHLDPLTCHELDELAGSLKRAVGHVERVIDLRYRGESSLS